VNLGYTDELPLRLQIEGKSAIDTQAASSVTNSLPLRLTRETYMSEKLSRLMAVAEKLCAFPPRKESSLDV
jgi:hypothetical protein